MRKRSLHVAQLLTWADAHREREGDWPNLDSGRVVEAREEKWLNIDQDLRKGLRGLPGGWSLARLLAEFRGRRNPAALPRHTEDQILAWADTHHDRNRRWPTFSSGAIMGAPGETWSAVDMALHAGLRGLKGGSSLAKLLRQRRRVRRRRKRAVFKARAVARRVVDVPMELIVEAPVRQRPNPAWAERRARRSRFDRPPLTVDMILAWADAFHERGGEWPTRDSGRIIDAPDETWIAVDMALHRGLRGLPPGWSLAQLLAEQRAVRNSADLPPLCEEQILAWADAHFEQTGLWPTERSGPIPETLGETWQGVRDACYRGARGLPRGSLARLIGAHGGAFHRPRRPQLSIEAILCWADAYHERHGEWPDVASGRVEEAPCETWGSVQNALRDGVRGLPAGLSLAKLLSEHRGVRTRVALTPYNVEQILAWVDVYHSQHGRWPTRTSGPIEGAPGETWSAVDVALKHGNRGLSRGSSLVRLLAEHRGRRNRLGLVSLTLEQILSWVDQHFARTGAWPRIGDGPIVDAPSESWNGIDQALRRGRRGLTAGSSLAELLDAQRGTNKAKSHAPLDLETVLIWADAFRVRHGTWPNLYSGVIPESNGDTWRGVSAAIRAGSRGLPGGGSLAVLLAERRSARNRCALPALNVEQILAWADAHRAQHGKWPTQKSGAVDDAPGETWGAINQSLKDGRRGLPGDSSLPKLLDQHRCDARNTAVA